MTRPLASAPAAPGRRPWPLFEGLRDPGAADLVAGLTLAAIAIPEQMATARLGGFPPQAGFFAFAAGAVGFAAFGGSRQLSSGADSTITPIFAGALALLALSGTPAYFALAAALALMVGAILVVAGLCRLGWIADLLSRPVLTGFLAGIAAHIALSQAPALLGLPSTPGDVFHKLAGLAAQAGQIQAAPAIIGLGVLGLIVLGERISGRIPGALIALAAATGATIVFHLQDHGVAVLGAVPAAIPRFAVPAISAKPLLSLATLAAIVSLVVMVQTAATSRSVGDGQAEPDINRDFVGVGAGSLLAGLMGAFPVDASPPRSAVVTQSGGRSQLTGLFAATVILLLAAFGTGLLAHVPEAALGGVLLFVALRILRLGTFAEILRRAPAEFALALVTAVLIIVLPIEKGVAIGIFLSLAHGVFTTTRARPIPFERAAGTTVWWPAASPPTPDGEQRSDAMVMGFQAPLSFLNADDFKRGMLAAIAAAPAHTRLLVLEASSIVEIDFTASQALLDVIAAARAAGMAFAVARLESVRAQSAFARFGITAAVGADHMFQSVDAAIRALLPAAPRDAPSLPS